MSLIEGSIVAGRFQVEELAGKGGMGEVFRARDVTTGERVALKLLRRCEGGIERATERFQREARLLADLKHPGIVGYVAHGEAEDGRPFLAMQWLAGQDLSQRLRAGRLRVDECATLLAKAAEALAVAHRHGVVHRDIKPSNLFLRDDRIDGITLLDFGIARWVLAGTSLTRSGALIGTIGYMAPEQARGDGEVGPSADVFALGCVLFECLTGVAPFMAQDVVGVLTKVLFDEVPPVETLRPETPPALARLLARMLDKDPARRPTDAAMLCEQLAGLELLATGGAGSPEPNATAPRAAVLTGDAMKLLCVVLAVPRADAAGEGRASTETGDPDPHDGVRSRFARLFVLGQQREGIQDVRDRLRSRLIRLGGRVEWMADGSLAVVVSPSSSAMDQAAVAARCALAVQEEWPEARIALTTGRGLFDERLPAGDAIDRAVSLLRLRRGAELLEPSSGDGAPVTGGVWLDELSAKLLEPRFVVTTTTGQLVLTRERAVVDESRPLLGRPTPCVGREQEISILSAAFERCIEHSEPAGALVIAPPGMGKSRLKHELLRRVRDRLPDVQVLAGSGTPMGGGSPHGLLAEAIRRLCEVEVGDPAALQEQKVRRRVSKHVAPAEVERVGEFLATLCGIVVEEPTVILRAARNDPKIMSDHAERAFLDFVDAETRARPCLLVLEDLHWGDAGTVKLAGAALLELRERPFFVLGFARPEVEQRFPRLWDGRTVQRIPLAGLSKKAAERLIAAVLGTEVPAGTVARIVEQAAGNALFLEELIRAAAEGKIEEQADTVLAMLQARLSCLEPQTRRLLCCASVFGQRFWRSGVIALLGQDSNKQEIDHCLDNLVQAEIVERQRSSRFREDTEYKFRHALVRDAAYQLVPEEDRVLGHRLAGLHLEAAGEIEPIVLAEHAELGCDKERAAIHYLHAAEQSYQSNDYTGMLARAEQGIACGPSGEVLGGLLALHVVACGWRQDWSEALQIGKKALELLPRGSVHWSRVVGWLLMITCGTGLTGEGNTLVEAITTGEPEPDAVVEYGRAVANAIGMLSLMGMREPALRLILRLQQVENHIAESEIVAHAHFSHIRTGFHHLLGDPWQAYDEARRAEAATETCDPRAHASAEWGLGMALAALGKHEEAERRLRGSLEHALRLDDPLSLTWARAYLMIFLAELPAPHQWDEIAGFAMPFIDHPAMEFTTGTAHGALARVLMARGRLSEAREQAEKALQVLQHLRAWRPPVYRTWIAILLRERCADAARQVAEEGLRCIESLGGASGHSEVALRLAIAEARAAAGDMDAAREALTETIGAIETRAAKIPDPTLRACYRDQIPEHVRARELARTWLDQAPPGDPRRGRA